MKVSLKRIILIVVFFLIIIQFIPLDRSNPPAESEIQVSPEIHTLLRQSCYDCHSHQTVWPWYSKIAPVSWLVAHDVKEGREHLNFSNWGSYTEREKIKQLEEIKEVLEKNEMPLSTYLLMHPEARLSSEQTDLLKAWSEAPRPEPQSQP